MPERYANIGIRIEDDVLINWNGPDVLSMIALKQSLILSDSWKSMSGLMNWQDILETTLRWTSLTVQEAVVLYRMHHANLRCLYARRLSINGDRGYISDRSQHKLHQRLHNKLSILLLLSPSRSR